MSNTKKDKQFEKRFKFLAENSVGYQHHIDFRGIEDFNDEAFAYVMKNVKGVNMLDLNETDVTNQSIKSLTNLEYVNEIRAKECPNITDECIPDLNKLSALQFLHVKSTPISVDGLLKLDQLSNLKTLMFSAEDIVDINSKLIQLKLMHLDCELIINSKPFSFSSADLFMNFLTDKSFIYKLKIFNQPISTEWNTHISLSSKKVIETEFQGTVILENVEWMEIKSSDENENQEMESALFQDMIPILEALKFPFDIANNILSTYILDQEIW